MISIFSNLYLFGGQYVGSDSATFKANAHKLTKKNSRNKIQKRLKSKRGKK